MKDTEILKLINDALKNIDEELNNLTQERIQEHKLSNGAKIKLMEKLTIEKCILERLKTAIKSIKRNNKKLEDYEQTPFNKFIYEKPQGAKEKKR